MTRGRASRRQSSGMRLQVLAALLTSAASLAPASAQEGATSSELAREKLWRPTERFSSCVASVVHALPASPPDAASCPAEAWHCLRRVGQQDPACSEAPPGVCGCLTHEGSFLSSLATCCLELPDRRQASCQARASHFERTCSDAEGSKLLAGLDTLLGAATQAARHRAPAQALAAASAPPDAAAAEYEACVSKSMGQLAAAQEATCPANAWSCLEGFGKQPPSCLEISNSSCSCVLEAEWAALSTGLEWCCIVNFRDNERFSRCYSRTTYLKTKCTGSAAGDNKPAEPQFHSCVGDVMGRYGLPAESPMPAVCPADAWRRLKHLTSGLREQGGLEHANALDGTCDCLNAWLVEGYISRVFTFANLIDTCCDALPGRSEQQARCKAHVRFLMYNCTDYGPSKQLVGIPVHNSKEAESEEPGGASALQVSLVAVAAFVVGAVGAVLAAVVLRVASQCCRRSATGRAVPLLA